MAMIASIIQEGLEAVGMGPVRMKSALEGADLVGTAGLLNSLELVQFITALCEITRIEVDEFLQDSTESLRSTFGNVHNLGAFLGNRLTALEEVLS